MKALCTCRAILFGLALIFCPWPPTGFCLPQPPSNVRIMIIEFHGLKAGIIARNLESLPNFKKMIAGPGQARVYLPRVLTVIPAGSVPDIASMYTGCYPGKTGIVSTTWFDRRAGRIFNPLTLSQDISNRILARNRVPTLFDYLAAAGLRSHTTMLMVNKGAAWSLKSNLFFWGNAASVGFLHHGRWIPEPAYVDDRTFQALVNGRLFSYSSSLAGLSGRGQMPDVMAVEFLGTDLFSHYPPRKFTGRGASMAEIQLFYARTVLDPLMGRLIGFLEKAGCYQDTIFVFVSDHGFSKIEHHLADKLVDRSLAGSFLVAGRKTGARQAEAVVLRGASTKDVYIRNRQTKSWSDPPRLLEDIKPAIDLMLARKRLRRSLNTILVRRPGRDGPWQVLDLGSYLEGNFSRAAFVRCLEPMTALGKYFDMPAYVDNGLRRQYDSPATAPDIKLVNRPGWYFEPDRAKYGHHGSYYRPDCRVSFMVAGPGLDRKVAGKHVVDRQASILDLVPMVLGLAGVPLPAGLEGRDRLAPFRNRAGR